MKKKSNLNKTNRKIMSIVVQDIGRICPSEIGTEIERFEKNGEMAPVEWFRFEDAEYNGKYVISIGYAPLKKQKLI